MTNPASPVHATPADAGNAQAASAAAARPSPSYLKVQTRRAFEEVALQIRDQLASGALMPGDRLPPERELAEQFQLSRNTVREALRSLEMAGILEFRKGMYGGAFVREGHGGAVVAGFSDLFRLGMFKPEHLKDARLLVSVAVARAACHLATADDLEKLRLNLEAGEAAIAQNDTAERVRLGLDFHRLLAAASGNPIMVILMDALMAIQSQLIELLGPSPDALVMPSRRRIYDLIVARDEAGAAIEMERNIGALHERYLADEAGKKAQGAGAAWPATAPPAESPPHPETAVPAWRRATALPCCCR
ncbi:MAG: FadR family transcriptional regulator [Comamonadaceae bacterium]|nr:MAG: FadR family transcriptional regulator [Comamonadaceae bacterium]